MHLSQYGGDGGIKWGLWNHTASDTGISIVHVLLLHGPAGKHGSPLFLHNMQNNNVHNIPSILYTHCIQRNCVNAISINVVAIIGIAITVTAIDINVVAVVNDICCC